MHRRSTLKLCRAKEVLIVHICRLLRLLVCRVMRLSSVILQAVHRVIVTNLDEVGDMVIINTSIAVEVMSRRNFVHISLRIARGADIVIIIILNQERTLVEKPMPSRETRDTENRPVTVVDILSSKRLDIIQDRDLARHLVTTLRSSTDRKAEAEENSDSVGHWLVRYAKCCWNLTIILLLVLIQNYYCTI